MWHDVDDVYKMLITFVQITNIYFKINFILGPSVHIDTFLPKMLHF